MLRAFIFPILSAASVALVQALFSALGRKPEGNNPQFRISKAVRTFCWTAMFLISLAPFALVLSGLSLESWDFLFFGVVAVFGVICCLWGDMYVLNFDDNYLTVGAFKKTDVLYTEIISASIEPGGQETVCMVIKTRRKTIAVSGFLQSLNYAEQVLHQKMAMSRRI